MTCKEKKLISQKRIEKAKKLYAELGSARRVLLIAAAKRDRVQPRKLSP
jgi:hypothetical protein